MTLPQFDLKVGDLLIMIEDCFLDGPTPEEGSLPYDRLDDEDWLHEEVVIRRIPWEDDGWPDIYYETPCFFCAHQAASYQLSYRRWLCNACRRMFSARQGTFMHGSPLSFSIWFKALYWWRRTNGTVTIHYLASELGVTQVTAWNLKKRIMKALQQENQETQKSVSTRKYQRVNFNSSHFKPVLTDAQIKEASELYATNQFSYAELGREYSVTGSGMSLAIKRLKAKHARERKKQAQQINQKPKP